MTTDKETAPRGALERVKESRFRYVALAAILLIAGVYMVGAFGWDKTLFPEPEGYPIASQRDAQGFFSGAQVDGALFFTFWGSSQQPYPLVNYRTLRTDSIHIVAYAPGLKELELQLNTWKVRNETEIYDMMSYKVGVYPRGFDFNTIQIPTSILYHEAEITYNGETVWRGGHQTDEAYIEASTRTYGEITQDRSLFMAFSLLVVLIAFGSVKTLYDRVKVVPKIPEIIALPAIFFVFVFTSAATFWFISTYAVRQVLWMGIPIFISSFVYGVYLLRPKYDSWFLFRLYDLDGRPWAQIKEAEVAYDGEAPILAEIGWKAFVQGKRRRLLVKKHNENDPAWYYPVEGETNDRLYYVDDQRYDSQGYQFLVSKIHTQKIEEFKASIVAEKATATALEKATRDVVILKADLEKKSIEQGFTLAKAYIDKLLVAVGMKETELEEHKVEKTKDEQQE